MAFWMHSSGPPELVFPPSALKIVVEVVLTQVLHLWLEVSKRVQPEKDVRSEKASFCVVELHEDHRSYNVEVNLAINDFGDITELKTVVSVSYVIFNAS